MLIGYLQTNTVLPEEDERPLPHSNPLQIFPLPSAAADFLVCFQDWCWRTDVEAETPILWPPDAKSWLIWKDPDAGKDWRWEEKGTTEDEMVGWHHWLKGHEFGWTQEVGDGQGGLECCGSWGCRESDTTEQLNWAEPDFLCYDGPLSEGTYKQILRACDQHVPKYLCLVYMCGVSALVHAHTWVFDSFVSPHLVAEFDLKCRSRRSLKVFGLLMKLRDRSKALYEWRCFRC